MIIQLLHERSCKKKKSPTTATRTKELGKKAPTTTATKK
jgi:hypothetical protein